jgi:hypothetical protein
MNPISPNILRLLLYRVLKDEISISTGYNYEGFVQVLYDAGLWKGRDASYYPIFANEYNKRIFIKGYCSTCKRQVKYPDGCSFAITTYCIKCWKAPIDGANTKYSRLYGDLNREFYRWDGQYQDECLDYLVKGEVK